MKCKINSGRMNFRCDVRTIWTRAGASINFVVVQPGHDVVSVWVGMRYGQALKLEGLGLLPRVRGITCM